MKIDGHSIGDKHKSFLIAEVGNSHDGSLGMAHAYIDAVAKTDIQAIKFQTHIADAETTHQEPWRVKFSKQDKSRFDYWKRMEFTRDQWVGLKQHADEMGLVFLSSPFSFEAVDLLDDLDIAAWKIASGEVSNLPLIERVAETRKPIVFSSGMSHWRELEQAVALCRSKIDFAILQCSSQYPCPPEKVGLNVIKEIKSHFDCPSGLSDHSGDIWAGLAAISLGANILEFHICFDKAMFGPDVSASIEIRKLDEFIKAVRTIERMLLNPLQKDFEAKQYESMRSIFTKSIVTRRAINAGTVISQEDICYKKPGSGIPAHDYKKVIGSEVIKDLPADHFLKFEELK